MENTIKKLDFCRLCGSSDTTGQLIPLFVKDQHEVCRCKACNLVFLNFDPTPTFLKEYYAEDFFNDTGKKHGYSHYENESKSFHATFLERIKQIRKFSDGGSLLDVGCATGTFLEAASKYWDVSGSEISAYAAKMARQKGFEVYEGGVEELKHLTTQFDVVTMWDVIEHVAQPVKTIKLIGNIVKPGGIVALTTGDVGSLVARLSGRKWHLYNIPQHLSYFDTDTIRKLLEQGGFTAKEICYPGLHLTLDYLFFRFITSYKWSFASAWYQRFSQSRFSKIALKMNLFDIMLVIAQKNV